MSKKFSLGRLSSDEIIKLIICSPVFIDIEKKLGNKWIENNLEEAIHIFKEWLKE